MKTKIKLYALAGAAGLLIATNSNAALGDGTIVISPGIGNANGGGAFTATVDPTGPNGPGAFYTFCLEYSEHLSYGVTYSYVENTGTILGGYSTAPDGTTTFDPISKGTAYLYYQWASGAIANTGANANLLQEAIWYFEGETTPTGASTGSGPTFKQSYQYTATQIGNNGFITQATTAVGASVSLAANGDYGVFVLNVYEYDHAGDAAYVKQDQLAIVPETSTIVAGALLLLPFGASTVRILRKNKTV